MMMNNAIKTNFYPVSNKLFSF